MASKISTSALAKNLGVSAKEVVQRLLSLGLIEEKEGLKVITKIGFSSGAEYKESEKYGKYIVWPEEIDLRQETISTDKTKEK